MQRLPLSVQNAYSDLLDRLQDDAVLEIGGKPVQRTIRGRKYWYARSYVGSEEREKYLGPDTPELRERIERLQEEMSGLREREERRRPLVQMLHVRGVPRFDATTGKVLQALARAGVFRLRGVLVGTHAFRLYPPILGVVIPEAHHATEDIDLAQFREISVALDDEVDPKIQQALAQVGQLTPAASLYPTQPTGYRIADTVVEILTPNQGPDRDEPVALPALGVHAKPLRFLDFLLAEAIPAAVPYRYG
ncbi:MAG: GSU2403 family nucleotidyltransferase fold protein, partial [Geminicoccaceae bacterium]